MGRQLTLWNDDPFDLGKVDAWLLADFRARQSGTQRAAEFVVVSKKGRHDEKPNQDIGSNSKLPQEDPRRPRETRRSICRALNNTIDSYFNSLNNSVSKNEIVAQWDSLLQQAPDNNRHRTSPANSPNHGYLDLEILEQERQIRRHGHLLNLDSSKVQFGLLKLLIESGDRPTKFATIRASWSGTASPPEDHTIENVICQLNRRLKALGLKIEKEPHRWARLVLANTASPLGSKKS